MSRSYSTWHAFHVTFIQYLTCISCHVHTVPDMHFMPRSYSTWHAFHVTFIQYLTCISCHVHTVPDMHFMSRSYSTWHAFHATFIQYLTCISCHVHTVPDMHFMSRSYSTWHAFHVTFIQYLTCISCHVHTVPDMHFMSRSYSTWHAFHVTFIQYLTCISWPAVRHSRLEHHEALDGFANIHLQALNKMSIRVNNHFNMNEPAYITSDISTFSQKIHEPLGCLSFHTILLTYWMVKKIRRTHVSLNCSDKLDCSQSITMRKFSQSYSTIISDTHVIGHLFLILLSFQVTWCSIP